MFRRAFPQSQEREEIKDQPRSRRYRLGSWLNGAAFGFPLAGGTLVRREVEALCVAPQPLEIVVLTRGLAEDVHHEKSVVQQQPFRAGFALAVNQTKALAIEPLFDGPGDGQDLRRALPRGQKKIFREGAGKLHYDHVHGLFLLSRFNGRANFGRKDIGVHWYRACFKMYSSTRAGTSP